MRLRREYELRRTIDRVCRYVVLNPDEVQKINAAHYEEEKPFEYLAEAPDDELVDSSIFRIEEVQANQIYVDTIEELDFAIRYLLSKNPRGLTYDDFRELRDTLEHEAAHGEFLEYFGFAKIKYSLVLGNYSPVSGHVIFGATTEAEGLISPITKLENAATFLAPIDPSPSDLGHVKSMGYLDVVDVASRIQAHNARGIGRPIPLPGVFKMFIDNEIPLVVSTGMSVVRIGIDSI